MAELRLYRTYRFIDKNPVIDRVRTLVQDEGLMKRLQIVHELSGVSTTTLYNWFDGPTRNPQHATIAAVITALGYREQFVRERKIDIEQERKVAADWLRRQNSSKRKRKVTKAKSNGNGAI